MNANDDIQCNKCGATAKIVNVEGVIQFRPSDKPPRLIITVICPNCGEYDVMKQPSEVFRVRQN